MSEKDVPLEFIGSSRDDLSAFPLEAKKEIGLALRTAQTGQKADNAKPLKGFGGASVLQITSNFDGDTYRTVYTVQLKGMIYVLHAFQKKDLAKRHQQNQGPIEDGNRIARGEKMSKARSTKSSGNVFADIGVPGAEEHLAKADLVIGIAAIIRSKGLSQTAAAKLIGIAQPDLSRLMRGHFEGFSYDRLFDILNALGENVRVVVSDAKSSKDAKLKFEFT
jgi:phage-related protein/predicted XRE-type DNA-binding protein